MPPKRKVKSGKMDARKTREPVSNHPIPTPPTEAETAATQAMNEALDEVLMTPPPTSSPSEALRISESKRAELLELLAETEEDSEAKEEEIVALNARASTAESALEKAHQELKEAHRNHINRLFQQATAIFKERVLKIQANQYPTGFYDRMWDEREDTDAEYGHTLKGLLLASRFLYPNELNPELSREARRWRFSTRKRESDAGIQTAPRN